MSINTGNSALKPVQDLPAKKTVYVTDNTANIRATLGQAVDGMLKYYREHPSDDNKIYKNCKLVLDGFKAQLGLRLTPQGKLTCLVTEYDGRIQGLAFVSRSISSVKIDTMSVAPWNIVPPSANRADEPNPFRGAAQQIVYEALKLSIQFFGHAIVDLEAASPESADSFNKMGFLTKDDEPLISGAQGALKGDQATAFMAKMRARGET